MRIKIRSHKIPLLPDEGEERCNTLHRPQQAYEHIEPIQANILIVDDLVDNLRFLSALDEVFDKTQAFQVEGFDYITKPFHSEEVIARIQTQITIHNFGDGCSITARALP